MGTILKVLLPFLISGLGIAADYATTRIGLNQGFYETHPAHSPLWAFLIFYGALTLLTLTLPEGWKWELAKNLIAATAWFGAVNNILVILGLFPSIFSG